MLSIALFAFTTITSWGLYGIRCAEFVLRNTGRKIYLAIYIFAVFGGSLIDLSVIWVFADISNSLMIIPNAIALLLLGGIVARETNEYFKSEEGKARLRSKQKAET